MSSVTDVPRSRRSSTNRSFNRQPNWRSPLLVRTSAPSAAASVSIVFAEPEQGSPLARVTWKVPSTSPSSRSVRGEGDPAPFGVSEQPTNKPEVPVNDVPLTAESSAATTSDKLLSSMNPSLPQSSLWFSSLTRSKGKAIMPTTETVRDPPQPPTLQIEPSTSNVTQATISRSSQPQIPDTPQSQSPCTGVGFSAPSTPPSSSPKERVTIIPSTPPPTYPIGLEPFVPGDSAEPEPPPVYTASRSTKSTAPSSIGPWAPSLPTTPPAPKIHSTSPPPKSPPLGQTAAINPSSSRFTLSIPLLGRPKVPLDSVLGKGKEKASDMTSNHLNSMKSGGLASGSGSRSEDDSTLGPDPGPDACLVQANPTTPPTEMSPSQSPSTSTLSTTTTTATTTAAFPNPQQPPPSASTKPWWDYVGWNSTSGPPFVGQGQGGDGEEAVGGVVGEIHDSNLRNELEGGPIAEVESAREMVVVPTIVEDSTPVSPHDGIKPESEAVESNNAAGAAESTTSTTPWLARWTSYYSSNSFASDTTRERAVDADGIESQSHEEEKTEAINRERAHEASENCSSSSVTTTVQTPINVDSSSLNHTHVKGSLHDPSIDNNPVASTITSHTSGWASFFSSRSLVVKSLGYGTANAGLIEDRVKRDENGVEVMDLDDRDLDELEIGRGRNAQREYVGTFWPGLQPTPKPAFSNNPSPKEDIAAGAKSKANAKKTKTDITSAPLSAISADVKYDNATPNTSSSSTTTTTSNPTPKTGNSGTSTPALGPSPSTSVSNKQPTSSSPSNKDKESKPSSPNHTSSTPTTTAAAKSRTASPAPSKRSISVPAPAPPNLVLPTWSDTFRTVPRNILPTKVETYVDDQGVGGKLLGRTMRFVNNVLFAKEREGSTSIGGGDSTIRGGKGKERAREGSVAATRARAEAEVGESLVEKEKRERFREFGKELPKAWGVLEEGGVDTRSMRFGRSRFGSGSLSLKAAAGLKGPITTADDNGLYDVLRGCRRVVVIGVHGWFPGAMIRTVLGEPTGTSSKFANMTEQALREFENEHSVKLDKITKIPLEGDGTIERRVERLYVNLNANAEWVSDLHEADAIIIATHSQGSIVSTHLLDLLIRDNHIVTSRNQISPLSTGAEAFPSSIGVNSGKKVQRVCCLALCGIHLGPLRYLSSSTLVGPYLQYFESAAARELFEFQNTESAVSKAYVAALQNVLDHGTKVLYVASLNDQVVPIYSGLFTVVSHPLILRALYIDGDAYHSSDFLSNLLVLLLRILNSGISDSGLLAHLSEATAGSLNGVGHSTAYEEIATYRLAVKYLFLTNEGITDHTPLIVEPFNANQEQNDYEIPWSLREIIADERVSHFFGREISELRDAFREWHPKTSILRDLKRKLQPIQRLPSSFSLASGKSKL